MIIFIAHNFANYQCEGFVIQPSLQLITILCVYVFLASSPILKDSCACTPEQFLTLFKYSNVGTMLLTP